MTKSYSTLSKQEAKREIKANEVAVRQINSSKGKAKAFLIGAGIISKDGTLAPRYR